MIPPVSGGCRGRKWCHVQSSPEPEWGRVAMIEITSSPIDHAAVTERVRAEHAGAVCTFLGTVRDLTGDRKTVALQYEAYAEMASRSWPSSKVRRAARWPIIELALFTESAISARAR